MYRNMLYLEKKHKIQLPELTKKFTKNFKHQINKNTKYSYSWIKVLKYKILAKKDFQNNKMGKIIE